MKFSSYAAIALCAVLGMAVADELWNNNNNNNGFGGVAGGFASATAGGIGQGGLGSGYGVGSGYGMSSGYGKGSGYSMGSGYGIGKASYGYGQQAAYVPLSAVGGGSSFGSLGGLLGLLLLLFILLPTLRNQTNQPRVILFNQTK